MVEEFRAPMVDRFVLRTLNRREVSPEEFEAQDDGSMRLSMAGRRRFLIAWEAMLEGQAAGVPNERRVEGDGERAGGLRLGASRITASRGCREPVALGARCLGWASSEL